MTVRKAGFTFVNSSLEVFHYRRRLIHSYSKRRMSSCIVLLPVPDSLQFLLTSTTTTTDSRLRFISLFRCVFPVCSTRNFYSLATSAVWSFTHVRTKLNKHVNGKLLLLFGSLCELKLTTDQPPCTMRLLRQLTNIFAVESISLFMNKLSIKLVLLVDTGS